MLTDSKIKSIAESVKDAKSAAIAANLLLINEEATMADAGITVGMEVISLNSLPTHPHDGLRLKVKSIDETTGHACCTDEAGTEYQCFISMLAPVTYYNH